MILTDTSPMPFGKHKGELMANVPASYLIWLYNQGAPKPFEGVKLAVRRYTEENMDVLTKEAGGKQ